MRKMLLVLTTLVVLMAATAAPVLADGGPIIRERDVWQALKEGQQIAVVALGAGNLRSAQSRLAVCVRRLTAADVRHCGPEGQMIGRRCAPLAWSDTTTAM